MVSKDATIITFRPYVGIYIRKRDYRVFGLTIIGNAVFLYLIYSSSPNIKAAVYCMLTAILTLALIVVSVMVDANYRSRTSYIASRNGLEIQRDGRTIKVVRAENLLGLRPKWVDPEGFGSADLPASDGAAYTFRTNGFETYIPSLNARRSIEVVPDIVEICAILRSYASRHESKATAHSLTRK